MTESIKNTETVRPWIAPEIRELDVRASAALPNRGADVGGNPYIDCQRS